jgi:hypothetical protein
MANFTRRTLVRGGALRVSAGILGRERPAGRELVMSGLTPNVSVVL